MTEAADSVASMVDTVYLIITVPKKEKKKKKDQAWHLKLIRMHKITLQCPLLHIALYVGENEINAGDNHVVLKLGCHRK